MFRRGLIEKLPTFNKIVNDVNTYNNITLNDMINQFSEILCSVANPLFERNNRSSTHSSQKDWFDADCIAARNTYKQALSIYNRDNEQNYVIINVFIRIVYAERSVGSLKNRQESLNPSSVNDQRNFGAFFIVIKKQSHGANIPTDDFQKYCSSLFTDSITTIHEEVEHLNLNSDFNTNKPT